MRVHIYGNIFECPSYESAKRLAGWFREELLECFTCVRCLQTTTIPLSQSERLSPGFRTFRASGPDADWWHFIHAQPGWPLTGWLCHECWGQFLDLVVPLLEQELRVKQSLT